MLILVGNLASASNRPALLSKLNFGCVRDGWIDISNDAKIYRLAVSAHPIPVRAHSNTERWTYELGVPLISWMYGNRSSMDETGQALMKRLERVYQETQGEYDRIGASLANTSPVISNLVYADQTPEQNRASYDEEVKKRRG